MRTDAFYHTVWPNTTEVVPPFTMFDNLYYIGTNEVAAYLIKTNSGLIMVDTLFDESLVNPPQRGQRGGR